MDKYGTPVAIVIAGLLIAGTILATSGGGTSIGIAQQQETHHAATIEQSNDDFGNKNSATAVNVRPIGEDDHIFGSVDAPVTIVEYSDYECPFCSQLHPTLTQVVEESEGKVRWVYRHFPLTSIHSRALSASFASECVAELAGNDAFWQYSGSLFENQRQLSDELYTNLANQIGIDQAAFSTCLENERHRDRVAADQQNAVDSGGRGTPFSVVITRDGEVFPFSGALPYESIQQIVRSALAS